MGYMRGGTILRIDLESGKIVMEGPSKELQNNPDVKEFYMGITQGGGRKSFKEVKSYKRRKRWM